MKTRLIIFAILCTGALYGQDTSKILIPAYGDAYSIYVAQLEAGETDIDFSDFRFSFLESEQFKVANKRGRELDSLQKAMHVYMDKSDFKSLVRITKQMLSIDYTSMIAHKVLRQTYQYMGDSVNAAKYKSIQFGLLKSIIGSGDGKSCATAWTVIQISEEYFILEIMGARLLKQSIDADNPYCEKMEVKEERQKKTYYFEISKVFEGYKRLGR